jgi:Fe-S-cluster-containing hydrogenase component 2
MHINPAKCPQNHPCPAIRVCPVQAISQKGVGLPVVDNEKCINCNKCISFCPMGAFEKE